MTYNIAIVGAGPAGLAAAAFLKGDGHAVTVFERAPELRASGAGLLLQPSGLAVLSQLGLDESLIAQGARIEGLHGTTEKGKTVIDLHYKNLSANLFGVGIHRETLFAQLLQKARQCGADFVSGCDVQSAGLENGKRVLRDASGTTHGSFDLVIDASGYKSPLRKHGAEKSCKPYAYGALWGICTAPQGLNRMEQRYGGTQNMVGLLPVGKKPGSDDDLVAFFWSMPADQLQSWKENGLEAWKKEVLTLWPDVKPCLDQFTDASRLTFAPYADAVMKSWHAPALAFIGDAAHSSSPQLGQGANMGFIDALTLAQKLKSEAGIPQALAAYSAERKGHIRFHQLASRLITPLFQSPKFPGKAPLRNIFLQAAARIPFARGEMTRMFAGVKKGPLKKVDPGVWNEKYGIRK